VREKRKEKTRTLYKIAKDCGTQKFKVKGCAIPVVAFDWTG
jgi:hypothetical protein